MHEFFSFDFPLREYIFFVLSPPPPPYKFSNGPSLSEGEIQDVIFRFEWRDGGNWHNDNTGHINRPWPT